MVSQGGPGARSPPMFSGSVVGAASKFSSRGNVHCAKRTLQAGAAHQLPCWESCSQQHCQGSAQCIRLNAVTIKCKYISLLVTELPKASVLLTGFGACRFLYSIGETASHSTRVRKMDVTRFEFGLNILPIPSYNIWMKKVHALRKKNK